MSVGQEGEGYQLSASLLVVSVCLLKSTSVQGRAHSQLPCQGGGQLPWFNACLQVFHPGVVTPFLVKDGKLKAPKGNTPMLMPALANRVMKTAGVSCSQEAKACFGGEAVPWLFFIYLFFFYIA